MPDSNRLSVPEISSLLLEALEKGWKAAVLVTITHPDVRAVGSRLLVTDGGTFGTLGEPEADEKAVALARRGLSGDLGSLSGTYPVSLASGFEMRVFLELHRPSRELIIVGAGHVAQPLCTMGALLGLRVTVLDDRPDFATRERFPEAENVKAVDFSDPFHGIPIQRWSHVVLVTRGHKYDYECLRQVLQQETRPMYIGMIGSRRRVRATFDALLSEGISRDRLRWVHAPIGLDIGGETPVEIAVSVAAELVHHWHGGTGRPLSELEHILDRFHPPAEDEGGEALP